jgi:hypothetical protein
MYTMSWVQEDFANWLMRKRLGGPSLDGGSHGDPHHDHARQCIGQYIYAGMGVGLLYPARTCKFWGCITHSRNLGLHYYKSKKMASLQPHNPCMSNYSCKLHYNATPNSLHKRRRRWQHRRLSSQYRLLIYQRQVFTHELVVHHDLFG